ncbi:dihydrofolate reductase [Peptostreptococcaceae bacterium OttesenSCG-928-C18]|nr:dihydrofolate reductase [Peptostreptococcaceae bacterium OttesenSCG-928-C18]
MKDIVAVDRNWGIGKNNDLLIVIPEDRKFFVDETKNNIVVMGKNTLDSLPEGKPLKNRVNIVLTSKNINNKDVIAVHSVEELLKEIKKYDKDKVYNIGGGKIFEQLLDYVEYSLVTKIDENFDADTFYPNLDKLENWEIIDETEVKEFNKIKYKILKYRNKNVKSI